MNALPFCGCTEPDAACRFLRHAIAYARDGRPVFPCHPDKTPLTAHGFKDATTDWTRLVAWWGKHPDAMIGMPTGKPSGVVAVDLDIDAGKGLDGVTAFNSLLPADAAPVVTRTHRTPRGGVHLLFAWPGVPVKTSAGQLVPGVDVRGDGGYIIMPPSVAASGRAYAVERDMDPQPLPTWLRPHLLTDTPQGTPTVTETTEHTEITETTEAIEGNLSAVSVTLERVLELSRPQRPGQRNRCLLDLARGLRFNLGMADSPLSELKPVVRRWHTKALPFITTESFDETWSDFVHSWPLAKHGLGDVLGEAWRASQSAQPPPETAAYDSAPVRALVALCCYLGKQSPEGRFFLSTHAAGRLLGERSMQVLRWLRMLTADGVIEVVKIGTERRATRYRLKAITEKHNADKQEGAPT